MNGPLIHDADELAAALRADPPPLDDLARARMERRVLAGPDVSAPAPARGNGRAWAFGGGLVGLAVAAAVALVVLAGEGRRGGEAGAAPVARFEVHEVELSARRGTLEEGSVLPTGPTEEAVVRIADSRVQISPASRVRIATLRAERLGLELEEGAVEVHFHPRERGREHLSVATPEARVEVVGTVFTVRRAAGATEVEVREGVVRVISLVDGEETRVAAGERARVEGAALAAGPSARAPAADPSRSEAEPPTSPSAEPEPLPGEGAPVEAAAADPRGGAPARGGASEARLARGPRETATAASAPEPSAPEPSAPEPSATEASATAPGAAEELARARALLGSGDAPGAEPILRTLARSGPTGVRVQALTLLADLERLSGRLPEAQRSYAEAARLGARTMAGANAIYALARLQERQLRDPAAARASYRRYLTEAPGGPLVTQAQAALCRLGVQGECP